MTRPEPTTVVLDEATQLVPVLLAELVAGATVAGVGLDVGTQDPGQLDRH